MCSLNYHLNPFQRQFVVYGGYYYVLTVIFLGAGVYKLTHTGWIKSFRICWKESVPKKNTESVKEDLEDEHLGTIQAVAGVEEDEESVTKPI